ncbi:MAG: dihydrodipicolinate synthase family protein [Phototrophicaceae bacterium]
MTHTLSGIFNILATPFLPDQQLDLTSLTHLVNCQLEWGANGLTILGVLGESAKLTIEERHRVMEAVLHTVNGRVSVVVGASHPDPSVSVELAQAALRLGAIGVMIAPPASLPNPNDDALYAYYHHLAEQINGEIVVQDFPALNGIHLSTTVLSRIAHDLPTCRHLKLEAPPLMQKVSAILAHPSPMRIFGGLGGMFLLEELQRGTVGTMTGFAFTEVLVAVYEAWERGDAERASALFDRFLPLIRYENQAEINLPLRKELLRRRGAIASATLRPPYTPLDAPTDAEIKRVLARVGIQDPTQRLLL